MKRYSALLNPLLKPEIASYNSISWLRLSKASAAISLTPLPFIFLDDIATHTKITFRVISMLFVPKFCVNVTYKYSRFVRGASRLFERTPASMLSTHLLSIV